MKYWQRHGDEPLLRSKRTVPLLQWVLIGMGSWWPNLLGLICDPLIILLVLCCLPSKTSKLKIFWNGCYLLRSKYVIPIFSDSYRPWPLFFWFGSPQCCLKSGLISVGHYGTLNYWNMLVILFLSSPLFVCFKHIQLIYHCLQYTNLPTLVFMMALILHMHLFPNQHPALLLEQNFMHFFVLRFHFPDTPCFWTLASFTLFLAILSFRIRLVEVHNICMLGVYWIATHFQYFLES